MLKALINENNELLQWPVYNHQIPSLFPNVTLPDGDLDDADLSHLGLINIPPTLAPTPPEGMKVKVPCALEWIDGKWTRTYEFVPLPEGPPAE